jgi:hypothetical protein
MKKVLFVLGILSLFLVAGCEKDNDTSNESILTGKQYYCNGSWRYWRYYTLRLEFLSEKEARFYFLGTQNPKSIIVNYTYIKGNETIIFNNTSFHEPDNIISYYIKSGEFFNEKQLFVIQYDWKYGDNFFQDYEFDFKLTE